MEVEQETPYGLSIGTVTFDLEVKWVGFNVPLNTL